MILRLVLLIFSLFCFFPSVSLASIASDVYDRFNSCMGYKWIIPDLKSWTSPGKYAQCMGEAYQVPLERSGTFPWLWNKPHRWIPPRGMVTVLDKAIVVQFQPDSEMIDFFKMKFIDSNARMPMGLEIDISPLDNDVFNPCGSVIGFNTNGVGLFLDTTEFDSHPSCGAVIRNPHKMESGKTYTVIFFAEGGSWDNPKQLIRENGRIRFGFQASMDTDLAKAMISAYDGGDHQLNAYSGDGNGGQEDYFVLNSDGFNEFNVAQQRFQCWTNKSSDDVGCANGSPFRNPPVESVVANGRKISPSYFTSGIARAYSGTTSIPQKGQGGASQVTDSPKSGKPNFVAKSIRLYDTSGRERYSFKTFSNKPISIRKRLKEDVSQPNPVTIT